MSTCSLLHYNPDCDFNKASRSHKNQGGEGRVETQAKGQGFGRSRMLAAKLQVQNEPLRAPVNEL
jgi:hypothetical protein